MLLALYTAVLSALYAVLSPFIYAVLSPSYRVLLPLYAVLSPFIYAVLSPFIYAVLLQLYAVHGSSIIRGTFNIIRDAFIQHYFHILSVYMILASGLQ